MTTFNGIQFTPDFIFQAEGKIGSVSGTVTKGASNLRRRLLLYRGADASTYYETWSSDVDGSFSFSIPFVGTNDFFTIICKGEGVENDEIYSGIQAILN